LPCGVPKSSISISLNIFVFDLGSLERAPLLPALFSKRLQVNAFSISEKYLSKKGRRRSSLYVPPHLNMNIIRQIQVSVTANVVNISLSLSTEHKDQISDCFHFHSLLTAFSDCIYVYHWIAHLISRPEQKQNKRKN
jgi:hypothetical protein